MQKHGSSVDGLPFLSAKCKVQSAECRVVVNFLASEEIFDFKKIKSLIKLFKVCGFSRQSLESRSAECEILYVLQAGGAPAVRLEGVNPPLAGGFRSFTPRAPYSAQLRTKNHLAKSKAL